MTDRFATGELGQDELHAFLESLGEISNNLVVRLIGNDLRTQLFERMIFKGRETTLNKNYHLQLLKGMRDGIQSRDGNLFSKSLEEYFEELRVGVFQLLDSEIVGESKVL